MMRLPSFLSEHWVPTLYRGKLDNIDLQKEAKGVERVSGHGLHIKEGIVVSPVKARRNIKGQPLNLKVINPKYKDEDGFN